MKPVSQQRPDALRLLREVVKSQGERTDFVDNINEVDRSSGTSKDYTLDRLVRPSAPVRFSDWLIPPVDSNWSAPRARTAPLVTITQVPTSGSAPTRTD